MHLRYDEDLVEEVVRLCTMGRRKGIASLQFARFNSEREKLYEILDPDQRNTAFFELHLGWFREWGLERPLTEALKKFPLLPKSLKVLAIRKSRRKNDEGSELYVNEAGDRSGVVAMRPERFTQEGELGAFLQHELTHLHDMVDPAFGYLPELPALGPFMNQEYLVRERYRLLWDVSIDGRLTHAGRPTIATKDQRSTEFASAFVFWADARQREVFEKLWNDPTPTHRMLADLVLDPRQLQPGNGSRPGALCPLCGFPTFTWAATASLEESTVRVIRSEFADWTPEQGACARCAEIYRVNRAQTMRVA